MSAAPPAGVSRPVAASSRARNRHGRPNRDVCIAAHATTWRGARVGGCAPAEVPLGDAPDALTRSSLSRASLTTRSPPSPLPSAVARRAWQSGTYTWPPTLPHRRRARRPRRLLHVVCSLSARDATVRDARVAPSPRSTHGATAVGAGGHGGLRLARASKRHRQAPPPAPCRESQSGGPLGSFGFGLHFDFYR